MSGAVRKFLGLPDDADPRALLGVPEQAGPAAIEAALRNRIGRTYRHPDGRSEEAESVRRRLREAAASLASGPAGPARTPRRTGLPAMARLTDFDRAVLAVLISGGGWNAATRARLVGVAGAYGVSVQGLIKVVTGLSEYARSGGPRLEVADITGGVAVAPAPAAMSPEAEAEADRDLVERLAPELREDSPAATFKLSLLFGLLTVLLAALAARILFAPEPGPAAPDRPPAAAPVAERTPATPAVAAPPPEAEPPRVLSFERPPTFRGQGLTAECAAAADQCPDLVPELESLARRITVAETPSDAVYRAWDEAVRTVATGWVLVDNHLLADIDRAIFEGLYAASDKPSVTDRLLRPVAPPAGRVLEQADIWRGAWAAGTLARIRRNPGLPPAVVERAQAQLGAALGDDVVGADDYVPAATAWLDRIAGVLIEGLEYEENAYDLWEFWLAAQRRLGGGSRHAGAVLDAVDRVLTSVTDLVRPRPTVNVLGRLLATLDLESPVARDRVIALVRDHERVEARDLWVLTSMLAQWGPDWYGADLVVPDDADWAFRRRLADRLADRWPAVSADPPAAARVRGIPVDAALAARWLAAFQQQEQRPAAVGDAERLDQLVRAAWLNEIALRLSIGDAETAEARLDDLERERTRPASPPGHVTAGGLTVPRPTRPGTPIGSDGQWAVEWEQARRNVEERIGLLQRLQGAAGTDLGPIDAATFVHVAFTESPPEVRVLAQDILVQQFAFGPNVCLELLDQFPQAAPSQSTSEMIRRLTARLLPSSRAESWRRETRLALVEHNLDLRDSPAGEIDERMRQVRDAYESRRACLDPQPAGAVPRTPHRSAAALAEAWWDRAAAAGHVARAGEQSVPGNAVEIERRRVTRNRVARGPLQRFVAAQLAVLDMMALHAVADRPPLAVQVSALLDESARRRREASHALDQAVESERAMGRLWQLQIALGGDGEQAGPAPAGSWRTAVMAMRLAVAPEPKTVDRAGWRVRLETLRPLDPMPYFELAEEIADASTDLEDRELARRLFALAGVLDPPRLGRSACLALADIESREHDKRRLLALAALLDDRGGGLPTEPEAWTDFDMAATLAVCEALSFYRRGEGSRALARLRTPGAEELIDSYDNVLRGGAARFREDCRLYNGGRRPNVTGTDLVRQLRFEAALLAGGDRTWAGELLMSRGRPLVEVDPDHLDRSLGIDADRACWRDGRWVACER